MKASLKLERIGDNSDYGVVGRLVGYSHPKPWVARITGLDLHYKFKRVFLKPKVDYTHSNSKGTRGVYYYFILESGEAYEVYDMINWTKRDRYFCTVKENGDIMRLKEAEVAAMFPEDSDWD